MNKIQCTNALADEIACYLAKGLSPRLASEAIGISYSTYRRWFAAGNPENPLARPEYIYFRRVTASAEARFAEEQVVRAITASESRIAQPAQWMLERRFPDSYGKQDKLTVESVTDMDNEGLKVRLIETLLSLPADDPYRRQAYERLKPDYEPEIIDVRILPANSGEKV